MIQNLNVEENNQFTLYMNDKKVLISFFEPGKFSDAFARYNQNIIRMEKHWNGFYFFSRASSNSNTENEYDFELVLPDSIYYDIRIENDYGTTKIKNGNKFKYLEINSKEVELENVNDNNLGEIITLPGREISNSSNFRISNVFFYCYGKSSIILKNSRISTIKREIGGSAPVEIKLDHSTVCNIILEDHANISLSNNSLIENINAADIDWLEVYSNNSTIHNILCKDFSFLKLEDSNIGSILGGRDCNVILSRCHFKKDKDIILKKGSFVNVNLKEETKYKKHFNKKITIVDESGGKIMKIKSPNYTGVRKNKFLHRK